MAIRVDYIGGPADRRSEVWDRPPPDSYIRVLEAEAVAVTPPWGEVPKYTTARYVEYRVRQVEQYLYVAIAVGYRGPA